MSSDNITRKKNTGEPGNGGEFGTNRRTDAEEGLLTAEAPALNETYTLRKGSKNGTFYVDNDITDAPAVRDGHFMTKTYTMGGDPHANSRQKTIAALHYPGTVKD